VYRAVDQFGQIIDVRAVARQRNSALAGLDLLNKVRRFGSAGMVVVLGASGSGKSSLVRAALVPRSSS
jgi:ABC-type phosphate/phosphonate transport system ATPase subunit